MKEIYKCLECSRDWQAESLADDFFRVEGVGEEGSFLVAGIDPSVCPRDGGKMYVPRLLAEKINESL